MKHFITALILLLTLCLPLGGCAHDTQTADSAAVSKATIRVAVSIVPQQTFIHKVGGERVSVVTMIPPGYSPETYAPGPRLLQEFSDADIYFTIGVASEETVLASALDLNPALRVCDLAAAAEAEYPALELVPGEKDPHVWMSPRRVIPMVETAARELAALDPDNASYYFDNARAYAAELAALDAEIASALDGLKQRTFIVFHPSMGYFAADYGLSMAAIEEHGKDATPHSLQDIIDLAQAESIRVIFYQEEHDSRQAETIAAEIGGQTECIAPLAADYIDNLRTTAAVFKRVLGD
ncbi:MAG: zinc ABC transporter substrate-binding protein [Syntrophomonadaceae bacterium]|nr:zinc ABC transporter substrate-binding protein [Syntrophomonadaceae bacterium]